MIVASLLEPGWLCMGIGHPWLAPSWPLVEVFLLRPYLPERIIQILYDPSLSAVQALVCLPVRIHGLKF